MNVAKFIATVFCTVVYTSAIWYTSLYGSSGSLGPLGIVTVAAGGFVLFVVLIDWVVRAWNKK